MPDGIHRIHINHGSAQSPGNKPIHSHDNRPAPDAFRLTPYVRPRDKTTLSESDIKTNARRQRSAGKKHTPDSPSAFADRNRTAGLTRGVIRPRDFAEAQGSWNRRPPPMPAALETLGRAGQTPRTAGAAQRVPRRLAFATSLFADRAKRESRGGINPARRQS
ncbi:MULTISPECIES: hypothetical protein [Burkholderia cepacia complex]|uniref:hypothetical protein n=1 Tax=Burkholderia cepacia complex TaxID=87882 RepID=UPI000AB50874|nr:MULTISPECIES: hypothetical protein [Burkholderia cepacia complex]MBJ9619642.1 hypothetical protein [Burkholderia multivorans]MBR8036568.1 hypothetical protein [Burkholderia vietnamiensis]MBR8151814.1 hypothetical protein [Burkholderia vietnamiensis]MBR8165661.1 hypothetical protein [Burkholderia vietnamiensis]MBU9123248.1 hypothetical protein [Burkholderia multivorans]